MIKSMTGFGRGEAKDLERNFIVEVKSVNHRYNDIVVRMPRKITYLEDNIKNKIKDMVKRGRVEVYINVENTSKSDVNISLNQDLANEYIKCLKSISTQYDVVDDISVSFISKFPDVLIIESKEEDQEAVWSCLEKAVDAAVAKLVDMRMIEGKKLAQDIENRCSYIAEVVDKIEVRSPQVVLEYKEKLRERVNEIIDGSAEIDEQRINIEIACIADKSNITEEIVRLKSHISQLSNALKSEDQIGRKLDFLIQEMNREVNTIGSKSNDLVSIDYVVDVKSELEKIREQVQNIE
ncbi:YicC family protein [Lutibacter sp. B2]|nr:YicC family protein [Lutibacter sp. B2]